MHREPAQSPFNRLGFGYQHRVERRGYDITAFFRRFQRQHELAVTYCVAPFHRPALYQALPENLFGRVARTARVAIGEGVPRDESPVRSHGTTKVRVQIQSARCHPQVQTLPVPYRPLGPVRSAVGGRPSNLPIRCRIGADRLAGDRSGGQLIAPRLLPLASSARPPSGLGVPLPNAFAAAVGRAAGDGAIATD